MEKKKERENWIKVSVEGCPYISSLFELWMCFVSHMVLGFFVLFFQIMGGREILQH